MIGVDEHTFLFDEVIDNSTQNEIYDDLVKPMVDKAVGGFNCTILAYGQTGAGKTYTMGFENNVSIIFGNIRTNEEFNFFLLDF